jgi:arylsulfatase A-like enzyme
VTPSRARLGLAVVSIAATLGCGGAAGGWQRLWTDRWEWHHRGTDWVRGVSDADLEFDITTRGMRLRAEILGLGPGPADIAISGRTPIRLRVNPGERWFLDAPVDRGSYSVSVPPAAAVGSPRLGAPLATARLLVVVLVDTLRDDHVSPERMPGVTAAFARGRRWRDTTASCSWTLPSVASLFTSRQVLDLTSPEGDLIGIPGGVATWAETLDQAGFLGAGVVANYTVHALNGFASGFSTYLVPDGHGSENDPPASWVTSQARQWLASHQGEDVFLYLHLMDPHHPYRSWGNPHLVSPAIKPLAMRQREATPEEQLLLRRLYADEVWYVDRALTPFLAELPNRAIVAFTSDHGEALGEHGTWGHGLNLFQEALRVPLLIRGPGVPAGEVWEPTQLLNLAPTLLDLVGVAPPAEMLGRPLWDSAPAVPTVSTTFGGGPLRWSWRDGRHKVVLHMAAQPGLGVKAGTAMLEGRPLPTGGFHFDLAADPGEHQPETVPVALLPSVARAFVATAGQLVPGLQVMLLGQDGPVDVPLQVGGAVEVIHAWGVGPMAVSRSGDLVELRCSEGSPICAAALRVTPKPNLVDTPSGRHAPDQLPPPAGDPRPGIYTWWNQERTVVVSGQRQTLERLRALGYIE